MIMQNRAVQSVSIQGALSGVKLRYLGVANAPLTVTAPSRNVYQVISGVDLTVAEQDMAWFLARRNERGRVLYQIVEPPAPVVIETPEPIVEFSAIENVVAEPLQIELESDDIEMETKPKRTRKSKIVE